MPDSILDSAPDLRPAKLDFIREIITADLASGKHATTITRFPPEPNGYLHIGHAKSICLNFGIAQENAASGARCHLRFDDTNPEKEELEYVESIKTDVKWLGFDWGEYLYYASDYFEFYYQCAVHLIEQGKAYVEQQSAEEMRANRGNLTQPGVHSPHRDRPLKESLDLFARMRAGDFKEGECVLRAKIDMASPNLNLRDPVIYRILHAEHHNTGSAWCIYPMYDFAHPLEDALEHITHSLCTLEFENHRPLYDWFIDNCPVPSKPRQIEFARLNLSYTIMSKRKLLQLVQEGHVCGWDDPRLPTLSGIQRPRCVIFAGAWASPSSMARLMWRYWSLTSGIFSTPAPRAAWPCSTHSRSSSKITSREPSNKSISPITPKTPTPASAKSPSAGKSGSNETISWKCHPKNSIALGRTATSACVVPISSVAPATKRTRTARSRSSAPKCCPARLGPVPPRAWNAVPPSIGSMPLTVPMPSFASTSVSSASRIQTPPRAASSA